MLRLWEELQIEADSLYYFDPDIVVVRPWSMFEDWVKCGVALCEDVNSPLSEHHPRRMTWRRYFKEKGISLTFKETLYANGGFIGLTHQDKGFLNTWKCVQEAMAPIIGGLNRSTLASDVLPQPFDRTDQDALNAAVEAWDGTVSIVGQEAMAFKPGMPLLPHALGNPKPWKWNPLVQAMAGCPPRLVDREYWKSSKGPITSQPATIIRNRLFALKIAAFIGRFYKRR
ncbi:hypothetical protein [Sabulibacter ruber]|uniref:hypothetical protein n=1 Tax=Sabulibacter ruber TaxID=2811901 RepID=UPI001A969A94|nr:hypothetical protein [Sabulibacter ruber]